MRFKQLKIEAKLLHKGLKSNFLYTSKRYLEHPLYKNYSLTSFKEKLPRIKLRHAHQVIAYEYGFDKWEDLKRHVIHNDLLFRSNGVGLVYKWFNNYHDARSCHSEFGGYLLRFWGDYVVCGVEYIKLLRLDRFPKEWEQIGFDWVQPHDTSAYSKLYCEAERQYTAV